MVKFLELPRIIIMANYNFSTDGVDVARFEFIDCRTMCKQILKIVGGVMDWRRVVGTLVVD